MNSNKNHLFFVVGHNRVVEQLIRNGANVNLTEKFFKRTAIHLAAINGTFLIHCLA